MCRSGLKLNLITFSIIIFIALIILGVIYSHLKNEVCTYCLKKFKNVKSIHDQVHLCNKHYELYKNSTIFPFLSVKCSSVNDENGIYLYNLSQELKAKNIYNHIISTYELDQSDNIITIQTLFKSE